MKQTKPSQKSQNPKPLQQIARENIKIDSKEIKKELAKQVFISIILHTKD